MLIRLCSGAEVGVSSPRGPHVSDDIASPDAFYEFEVTNPAGTHVTIDTEGSQLPTVVALFPSGASFTTNVRDNATGLCCALREEAPGLGQASCTDGTDNDGVNGTDGADPDCAGAGQCRSGVACDARPDALIGRASCRERVYLCV